MMRGRRANLPFNKEGRIAPYTREPNDRRPLDQTSRRQRARQLLVADSFTSERLNEFANKYWAPHNTKNRLDFSLDVIDEIYKVDLMTEGSVRKKVMLLEFSQYLENYLWPNFKSDNTSVPHIMSIVLMVNEKFRERVPAWSPFQKNPEQFPKFFERIMDLSLCDDSTVNLREQTALLVFLDHCFTSMEIDLVRCQIQKLVSLSMWWSLDERRRESELKKFPRWKKFWKAIQKKDLKETEENLSTLIKERTFLKNLIDKFTKILEKANEPDTISYCEHFLLLMIDLEALLPTRRFFNTVLDDSKLLVRCTLSDLYKKKDEEGKLFSQLLEQLKFYARFEISDETGDPLDELQMMHVHYDRITSLQKAVFVRYPEMRKFALATVASIDDRTHLTKHFGGLKTETLYDIAEYLFLVPPRGDDPVKLSREFLIELLITRHEKRESQLQEINEMPLYPIEEVIWDENIVPGEFYTGEGVLALPKLNIQFLTLLDYLLRNFKLFQLESTYEIRGDIEDVVLRLKPFTSEDNQVVFSGWARMALPLQTFCIVEVAKPNIGEKQPSRVRADITVNLSVKDEIKSEWENLRRHDVVFLITVRPPRYDQFENGRIKYDPNVDFVSQMGLMYVRGCEVEGMLDENGRVIEEGPEPKPVLVGERRSFRVQLDCNQYHLDMEDVTNGAEDVYETFNIVMRRKPKENNFKAVLETIRELMNTQCVVPDFLHDIVLGYGDPGAAHYTKMPNQIKTIDFNDTFLSLEHLRHSFPGHDVEVAKIEGEVKMTPPFRVTFNEQKDEKKPSLFVESVVKINRGPYPFNEPKRNNIPFTPTQIEAIRSGVNPGLTVIVGPPGTGKTDVAVQIISNIYHNFPEQRTLIVTHSNQALNQLFEKIMALDVDERHLLRLGHGEESLETEKDFSRYGRVNYVLGKRIKLLDEVSRLKETLNVEGDVGYTCETASYFYLYHVISRWEKYTSSINPKDDLVHASKVIPVNDLSRLFPFHGFFSNAPQPLFKGESFDKDYEAAEGCWRYIQDIFAQLEEFRAFELLRSGLDRTRYLCVKEAKIIAMTCTHAALKRKELVNMGFKYDNILMEESAQILEIETFIPLLLQNPQDGRSRLKRWIMIGDHHQLPPVIKNMAFQKFCNMEQSLFTRLVRLGVPTVDLDAQGRARPSICSLYNWRYRCLGNLSHVLSKPEYLTANPGLVYDYQVINVPDFNGVGESQPSPFFYQNLAEAEYVVALFMYMRLLGYPAEKISMLTTYNGQKHLLRDVVNARCANNPLIGRPHKITTVDKYQGQQNDYILLSLVKTNNVGHLRDVRRLVVAMSRARLGLYIFARVGLFRNCFELQPAFNILCKRPQDLQICPQEGNPTNRQVNVIPPEFTTMQGMEQMCQFVYDFYAHRVAAMVEMNQPKQLQKSELKISEPEGKTEAHPGDDRDSDDEMDGKAVMNEIINEVEN